MKTPSQNKRILAYLKTGRKLTGLEALIKFGAMHLPRRIKDCRQMGALIDSEWHITKTKKRVKRYFIAQ